MHSKMIVPVRVDGAANEWCIVELQGELIPNDGADMKDVAIGSLWYENGVPTMRIGNHIVAGKVAKLPKPFAVLERHAPDTRTSADVGEY
jgi:chromosome transmission fidelity protein 8